MNVADLREAVQRDKLHIAIDGTAASGKTALGRKLHRELGCAFLDTGLMYRSVTLAALQEGVASSDEQALVKLARDMRFSFSPDGEQLLLNEKPLSHDLHSAKVDEAVSEVSAHAPLRQVLVEQQRRLAQERCIVMIGRDIGTHVLADAPVKLWLTASPETRARRREAERLRGRPGEDNHLIDRDMVNRDKRDSERQASPLRKAEDAVEISTDNLSMEDVLEGALQVVAQAVTRLRRSS